MFFDKFFLKTNKLPFNVPILQCHRGYWVSGLQQNSLDSIKKAYELGYLMSEFDIRITKDKHIILFHDDVIKQKKISDMYLSEIEQHQHVDSFEDVIRWFSSVKPHSYFLNVEIKSKFLKNRTLEQNALKIILKYKVQDRILISSFNPLSLHFFKNKYPQIIRALLLTLDKEPSNNFLLRKQMLNILARPHFLNLDEKYWSRKRFSRLLKMKIPIVLWTCNDLENSKKYLLQGVYGIISDRILPNDINKN